MPGPETQTRPAPDQQKHGLDDPFNGARTADASHQQLDVYTPTNDELPPLSADVVIPDDISELTPPDTETGDPSGDTPTAEGETSKSFKVVLAGLDKNIDAFAREAAHEKIAAEKEKKGPFFKRVAKNIWDTLTREYQVVKGTVQAKQDILEHNNLRHHHGEGVSDEKWRSDVVRRFGSEYAEALIHQDAGETFHKFGSPEASKDPNVQRMQKDIQVTLRDYATGKIADKENLEEVFDGLRKTWRDEGISQDYIGEGQLMAHNLGNVGEQMKAALEAAQGLSDLDKAAKLDEMLSKLEIVTGEAKVGSRTEIDPRLSERLAEKLKGSKFMTESRIASVVSFVGNEVFVAAMVSAVVGGGNKVMGAFLPGLGAGVVAGIRERRALKDERALAARRLDIGREHDPSKKRQAELDKTMYETRSAQALLDQLGQFYSDKGELTITNREDLMWAIDALAEAKAREDLNLINFAADGSEKFEESRFDLASAMAKLKTDLDKLIANPAALAMLDLTPDDELGAMITSRQDTLEGMLKGEMQAKDKLFNKFVRKRVLFRGAVTAATVLVFKFASPYVAGGVSLGLAHIKGSGANVGEFLGGGNTAPAMELASNNMPLEPNGSGVVDAEPIGGGAPNAEPIGSNNAPTAEPIGGNAPKAEPIGGKWRPIDAERIGSDAPKAEPIGGGAPTAGPIGGEAPVAEQIGGKNTEVLTLPGSQNKVVLPEGFKVTPNGAEVTITAPNGETFAAELNKDGSVSQQSLDALRERGFNIIDHKETVQGPPTFNREKLTAEQFVENHKGEMVKAKPVTFMDNDTSGVYDKNELGLQNHVRANGDVVASIAGMTREGSFHNGTTIDWHDAAKENRLFMYISASKGSQLHTFKIPIDAKGHAIIAHDSPARSLFDSHGNFLGGYERAGVQLDGVTKSGAERVASLATEVGSHHHTFTDTIPEPSIAEAHTYIVTPPVDMNPTGFPLAPPIGIPVVPIYGRTRFGDAEPEPEPERPAPPAPAPALAPAPPITPAGALPPAPTPPTPPGPAALGSSSDGGEKGGPESDAARREREFNAAVDAEKRDLPDGFNFLFEADASEKAQRTVTWMSHQILAKVPRDPGVSYQLWRLRALAALQQSGRNGLRSLDSFPPAVRPLMEEAFRVLESTRLR